MQSIFREIKGSGAELVAISPQLVIYSKQIRVKNNLEFDILSDAGKTVAENFSLKFAFPDYFSRKIGFGADFERFNGDILWALPIPAWCVVRKDGIIKAADFTLIILCALSRSKRLKTYENYDDEAAYQKILKPTKI